jgi:hypothetical protein
MLLLPAGLHTLITGALLYGGCVAVMLIIEARYGIAGGACQHAAVPLTTGRLLAAAQQQQWQQHLPAVLSSLMLPLLVSCAWRWLQRRQSARARQASSDSAGSAGAEHPLGGSAGPSKPREKPAGGTDASRSPAASGSGGTDQQPAARAAAVADEQGQQQATQLAASSLVRLSRDSSSYHSPASDDQHPMLHLKLVGSDAAAEEAFESQLPGVLASVVEDLQQRGSVVSADALLQLLQVATFPGGSRGGGADPMFAHPPACV